MKTSYYTINDQILGERSSGNDRITYAPDALGSVIGTVASSSIQNAYTFGPFGSLLSKVGVNPDPAFTWIGAAGYRHTSRSFAEQYVRARHYTSASARWTSIDILWPMESPYAYADGRPASLNDPTGKVPEYYIRLRNGFPGRVPVRIDRVEGTIALPTHCNSGACSWYNFYLAVTDPNILFGDTRVECGVSFTCCTKDTRPHRGWMAYGKGYADAMRYFDAPNLAAGRSVNISLVREGPRFRCLVNNTLKLVPADPPKIGSHGQFSFGGNVTGSEGHTQASWSNLRVNGASVTLYHTGVEPTYGYNYPTVVSRNPPSAYRYPCGTGPTDRCKYRCDC